MYKGNKLDIYWSVRKSSTYDRWMLNNEVWRDVWVNDPDKI